MEQLINGIDGIIKANSGKSLHQETQQANEDNDTKQSVSETAKANSNETNMCGYFLFSQLSNNQRIDAKNPSHKNYKKNDNNRSKPLNP